MRFDFTKRQGLDEERDFLGILAKRLIQVVSPEDLQTVTQQGMFYRAWTPVITFKILIKTSAEAGQGGTCP